MRLQEAHERNLMEARFITPMNIMENDEAPRWRFRYDNFNNDPTPDILLLGSYRHPRTGNNLVGGINLHYLNKNQVDELARNLPQIMRGGSLYRRYHEGLRACPEIFHSFYRTYNSQFIRGVRQDIMYPKYGFMKTASDWLKKKIGGMFKTKAQREKEAEPKYPDDLQSMRTKLNQVVTQLQSQPPEDIDADAPEMQAARDEYIKAQKSADKSASDIERDEDIAYNRAAADYAEQLPQVKPTSTLAATTPTPPKAPAPAIGVPQQPAVPPTVDTAKIPEAPAEAEAEEEAPELNDIADLNTNEANVELDEEEDELNESLVYYSPLLKRYIIEPAYKIVHSNW